MRVWLFVFFLTILHSVLLRTDRRRDKKYLPNRYQNSKMTPKCYAGTPFRALWGSHGHHMGAREPTSRSFIHLGIPFEPLLEARGTPSGTKSDQKSTNMRLRRRHGKHKQNCITKYWKSDLPDLRNRCSRVDKTSIFMFSTISQKVS